MHVQVQVHVQPQVHVYYASARALAVSGDMQHDARVCHTMQKVHKSKQ